MSLGIGVGTTNADGLVEARLARMASCDRTKFLLVIPAALNSRRAGQAGIQPLLCFGLFKSRASTRPTDERVTFFACPTKVTKEMHPGSRALRATRYGFARSCRGSLEGHPVHSRTRAHPARDPTGESVMPSPRLTGTRGQKPGQKQSRARPIARPRKQRACFLL